jgi:hypothetical protein
LRIFLNSRVNSANLPQVKKGANLPQPACTSQEGLATRFFGKKNSQASSTPVKKTHRQVNSDPNLDTSEPKNLDTEKELQAKSRAFSVDDVNGIELGGALRGSIEFSLEKAGQLRDVLEARVHAESDPTGSGGPLCSASSRYIR